MVGSSATALGYQMMVEGYFLQHMGNAADKMNFYIASAWVKAYADFTGIKRDEWPEEPMNIKANDIQMAYQGFFFTMVSLIGKKIRDNLAEVRKKYRPNQDLPQIGPSVAN